LHFLPTVALALNLELDHTDYFDGIESIKRSFVKALRRASDYSVICADDENLRKIRPLLGDKTVSFGLCEDSDYRYRINEYDKSGFGFTVFNRGREMGGFRLNIPGSYNVANATAAIAVATESGIDRAAVFSALSEYRGIGRRLELVGRRGARSVYYDYAHHPTEIRAAINALRIHAGEPITVVFKPHTFSRTKDLWADFVSSLSLADYLIVTDIFGAREQPIPGICAKSLAAAVGRGAIYCDDADVSSAIDRYTRGTVVLMGAGNFDEIKNQVLNK
jgi:UDP-N-acetylmuramate--alanine ligase